MRYLPLADRVIVRPDPDETVTSGGIFIPDKARERPRGAVIVAVGPGKLTEHGLVKPRVEVGMRVICHKHKGLEVMFDGVECLIMAESDVMAVEIHGDGMTPAIPLRQTGI